MNAAPDLLVGEEPEEPFDLIDPGCRSRGVMGMPAWPLGEPVADQLGLMRGGVVHHDVDVQVGWHVTAQPQQSWHEGPFEGLDNFTH